MSFGKVGRIGGTVDILGAGALAVFPDTYLVGVILLIIGTTLLIIEFIPAGALDSITTPISLLLGLADFRIPLNEFYSFALKRGWEVTNGDKLDVSDLAEGLRQAALDGEITIYGRLHGKVNGLLERIEQSKWNNYWIDGIALIRNDDVTDEPGVVQNNRYTRVYLPGSQFDQNNTYVDIHLERKNALRWFRKKAESFKGISKRK